MNQVTQAAMAFIDALAGITPAERTPVPWHEAALRGHVFIADGN